MLLRARDYLLCLDQEQSAGGSVSMPEPDVSSHTVLSPMSHHQDANQIGPHHSSGPHNGRASMPIPERSAGREKTSNVIKWEARKCLTSTRRLEKTVSSV
jgi:hypothetical protein